jgi:hypothetical protein
LLIESAGEAYSRRLFSNALVDQIPRACTTFAPRTGVLGGQSRSAPETASWLLGSPESL